MNQFDLDHRPTPTFRISTTHYLTTLVFDDTIQQTLNLPWSFSMKKLSIPLFLFLLSPLSAFAIGGWDVKVAEIIEKTAQQMRIAEGGVAEGKFAQSATEAEANFFKGWGRTEIIKAGETASGTNFARLESMFRSTEFSTLLKDDQFMEQVVQKAADDLHATWQRESRATGRVDRYKPMKVDGKTIGTQEELNNYFTKHNIPTELRSTRYHFVEKEGKLIAEEDILNIDCRYLAPNNAASNRISAEIAVELVRQALSQGTIDFQRFLRNSCDLVHDEWKLRNQYIFGPEYDAKPGSIEVEQRLPFSELSAAEAKKDVDVMVSAITSFADVAFDGLSAKNAIMKSNLIKIK